MNLLITGGCGFIGTNFIRLILADWAEWADRPNIRVVNFDKLTYAGNLQNLEDLESSYGKERYHFVHGDIIDSALLDTTIIKHDITHIIHFAAESHVDRSIADATPFITTNVLGTQTLLDAARRANIARFVHISTDEVYGSLGPTGAFHEASPLAPNSPYSASKAASDLLVRAAHETYGLDVITTRCSNNYGPYQFPEKLIPLMLIRALRNEDLPVYGDGLQVRDWIHVDDHCRGILLALEKGKAGAIYNFGGHAERTNLDVVTTILQYIDKPTTRIRHIADRLGHDRRYAMDFSHASKTLGYKPIWTFEKGLEQSIQWYLEHPEWITNVTSGAYRTFCETLYGDRL